MPFYWECLPLLHLGTCGLWPAPFVDGQHYICKRDEGVPLPFLELEVSRLVVV